MGKKIAIIGGGVSGLACAQRLAAESESSIDSIVVFDTGNRTCGGRISSRMDKQSGYEFDHAAQYFSVKDNKTEFAEYCREATKRGELYAIDDLSRYGILMREEDKQQHYVFRRFEDELVRYASKDGFRAFIKHLEESVLDVASDRKNRIERPQWVGSMQKTNSNTWLLANTQDRSRKNYRELGEYDFVVIAHNGKCAFNLMKTAVNNNAEKKNESPKILSALKASFGIKTREALYKKRELVLSSIWSANVAIGNLDEDTMQKLDAFDGAHVIENESLAYIGNNTLKKKKKDEMNSIREITLLSTPVYGKRNKCPQEAIPAAFADKVQLDLVTELGRTLGIAPNVLSNNVVFSKMQLWGAANGLTVANNEYLFDANASVGVCGDWLTTDDQSPSVETAMRSGWRLAEALLHESTENHLQVNWKPVQNASALGLTVPGADLPDPPPEEADDAKNAAGKKTSRNTQQRRKRARKPPVTATTTIDWWKRSAKIDKKTIASLGSACLLSYGFVSNLFYVSSLLVATYTSIKATGQSPVTSSESLKVFASSYFGLWMIQNVVRPARFAFSVAISPKTDTLVEFFQKYVPGNKKSYAFGLTVFSVNVVGTIAYMFGGFALIYAMTGVPLDVGKLFGAAVAAKKAGGVVA
ncbi:unnamed protein product [Bathycoccus prasinos]